MFLSFDEVGAIPEIGILDGDGYVSIGKRSAQEIAALILERVGSQSSRSKEPKVTQPSPQMDKLLKESVESSEIGEPMREPTALIIWIEKLDYLQQQEAMSYDPAQKFTLRKQIEEARAKIRELGG